MLHSMLYTIVDNFNNNFHAVCRLLWTFRPSIIIVISSCACVCVWLLITISYSIFVSGRKIFHFIFI